MHQKGVKVLFWCNVRKKLEGGYLNFYTRQISPVLLKELLMMVVGAMERLW